MSRARKVKRKLRKLVSVKETQNLSWLLGEYGIRFVIQFGVGALVARHLGPDGFAAYALLFTLLSLVIPFTDAGLNHLISRAVLTEEQPLPVVLGTAAALRFATCLLGIPVLVGLALLSSDGFPELVGFAFAAGVLNSLSCLAVLDYYFQSQLEARRSAIARTAALGIASVLQIGLLLADAGTGPFLWVLCLEQPLFGIMYYVVHRRHGGIPLRRWRIDLRYSTSLLSRSVRLNASAILSAIAFRMPAVILARFAAPAVVGFYGAASRPVEIWFVLPNAIAATLFPRMVRSKQASEARYNRFLRVGYGALTLGGVLLSVGIVLVGPFALELIYGSEYAPASSALRVYALILPFVFFRAFMSKWLVLEERYWLSVGSQALGAVVAVGTAWLLMQSSPSAVDAAIATLLSLVAASVVALALSPAGRRLLFDLARGPSGSRRDTKATVPG